MMTGSVSIWPRLTEPGKLQEAPWLAQNPEAAPVEAEQKTKQNGKHFVLSAGF